MTRKDCLDLILAPALGLTLRTQLGKLGVKLSERVRQLLAVAGVLGGVEFLLNIYALEPQQFALTVAGLFVWVFSQVRGSRSILAGGFNLVFN
ncbi:MAG TPA: hypothetical protein VGZ48_03310 [Candidatus Acidoferrales bacterium]|jgi:hypothetical protein|nr:hypothetical protein [Candidatus Acidoferrales bacterium]